MLGGWYVPPGKCQVIWTITEGTIPTSRHAIQFRWTRIPQAPHPPADRTYACNFSISVGNRSAHGPGALG